MLRQQRSWLAAGLSAVLFANFGSARAADAAPCSTVSRSNLISCALRVSLGRRAGLASVAAAEGRVAANDPLFPAPPTLSGTAAHRRGAEGTALNWSATLGLELEIAGQRGARRRAALAEQSAERKNVEVLDRSTAAAAWRVYFDSLAATQTLSLVQRLELVSKRVSDAAHGAAERGASAGVDADLAEAAYVKILTRRLAVQRDWQRARTELASLVGLDPERPVEAVGPLDPLPEADGLDASRAVDRPEGAVLDAESRAFAERAEAQRKSRVPNPTVSAFVQNDGFNERVFGVGIALPLPLPEPIGRMHAGEIAESEALSQRATLLAAESRRRARANLVAALGAYAAARETNAAYTSDRIQRAEAALVSLAAGVESGRVSTRDAVILQEPLFDLLLGAVEARRVLCVSSVDLLYAAGLRMDQGGAR